MSSELVYLFERRNTGEGVRERERDDPREKSTVNSKEDGRFFLLFIYFFF